MRIQIRSGVWVLLIAIFSGSVAKAQNPTLQEKLYYTCKVWGYTKYFHSQVSTCQVNWDSVLLRFLPAVKTAVTKNDFNDVLDSILLAAGPMQIAITPAPAPLPPELRRNLDLNWFNDVAIRTDIKTQLDTIRNNFRPHANCWVDVPNPTPSDHLNAAGGYLRFQYDSIILPITTAVTYPDQDQRLMQLFRFWNIIRYFNPYNYVLDVDWDTMLFNFVLPITNVNNGQGLYYLHEKMATALNDAHVEGFTYSKNYFGPEGFYRPYVRLYFANGEYTVFNSLVSGINRGDVIVSIDGLTPTQWEDSLRPYVSAGNPFVFRRAVRDYMLGRTSTTTQTLVVKDSTGAAHTFNLSCVSPTSNPTFFYEDIYFNDSLKNFKSAILPCDIGYVNMANIEHADVNSIYNNFKSKTAIIFDFRHEATTGYSFAELMYPTYKESSKVTLPDVNYPGTYYWEHQFNGVNGNPNAYGGKVVLLFNEGAQSHVEWHAMKLIGMPNVVKVGSPTAGADGVIVWLSLSNDTKLGWTSTGVYFPNGDSTQRIGLVPDSFATPTPSGIRHHLDEVLEKGLEAAGCKLYTKNVKTREQNVRVYPNPVTNQLTIEGIKAGTVISVSDITGRVMPLGGSFLSNGTPNPLKGDLASGTKITFDTKHLAAGTYILRLQSADGYRMNVKVVKE
jgi:carboxyl-terminal processing protease